jgi:hypothetical protein
VQGVVRAQGFIQYSDARLKTDITELTDALTLLTSLEGKTYRWKQDQDVCQGKGSKRVIGLIAQEVQKILPEVRQNFYYFFLLMTVYLHKKSVFVF